MTRQTTTPGLAEETASRLRARLTSGELRPGERLSEARLAGELDVSRNTLREVFRLLTREGLLTHLPNRGMSVAVPSMGTILDIYRIRRLIEIPALAQAWPRHAAVGRMADAVASALAARDRDDWLAVGSANMEFHAAIVDLADSPRLAGFFAQITAELRLAFGLMDAPELLHAPFIEANQQIVALLQQDQPQAASERLATYLDQSERVVMSAFARIDKA
ncbi:GntR family transcriptional regulator [Paracoccus sp. R86501]|uniref:GntR family transcriptional regulator n=1 Tax=Paracoccus sp. R86501 TaxID=3101711 RepID=UPI0036733F5B